MAWRGRDITVALNVRDGEAHVPGWLDSLTAQTLTGFQVLVVDDGSTDDTVGLLASHPHLPVRVLERPARGLQAARRELLEHVRTPLVLVLDVDIRLVPDGLEQMVQLLVEGVAGVGGRTRDRSGTPASRGHDAIRQWLYARRLDARGDATWIDGSPALWRIDAIRALGGTAADAVSEDLDLSFRARDAGMRLALTPEPVATHPDPATWSALWRREAHTGRREGRMAARGERRILRGSRRWRLAPLLGPFYVPAGMASMILMARWGPPRLAAWWAFQTMLVAYSVGFAAGRLRRDD